MTLGVDMSVRAGGFEVAAAFAATAGVTALFGRSGSGKTTILRAIAGLLRPESGRIALDGRPLFDKAAGVNLAPEARGVGFVFQDARLFPHMSVRVNLDYGARRRKGAAPGFDAIVDLLGIEALLERRPATLSGGERQRVAIGRALLSGPDLLILDEPLSSVDRARRDEILPFLDRLRRESALPILMVTHEPDEILRLADRVVIVGDGKANASGAVAGMFARPEMEAVFGRAERGAVLEGSVVAIDADGLAAIALGKARLELASTGLAAGQNVRLRIRAGDVALAVGDVGGLSVRNQIAATIVAIRPETGGPSTEVDLDFGGGVLLARVTKRSAAELDLRPGLAITALVKAVSVERAW